VHFGAVSFPYRLRAHSARVSKIVDFQRAFRLRRSSLKHGPLSTIEGVLHALCNAHHLRELKALVEIEKEEWARKMQRLLRRACHITNRARERGVPLRPRLIECFERRYDAIIAEGRPSMRPNCRWCAP
jgi:hypothetical protein